MKTLPLFGTGIRAISDIVTRQRRVNVYYHIRDDQDSAPIVLMSTPGVTYVGYFPTKPIRGWRVVRDVLYVVAGNTLYSVSTPTVSIGGVSTVPTALGTLNTSSGYVSLSDNSLQLIAVDGDSGYLWDLTIEKFTEITDPDFPYGATSVDYLNARFIVNVPRTREFRMCATLDGSLWSPIIYGTKENNSDLLARVYVLNGALVLWGTTSVEFWQDVATSPNPFQRINGATQQWGLAAEQSLSPVGNTAIFLGRNPNGALQVIKLNGYAPQRVSTDDIEKILSTYAVTDDAVSLSYTVSGHIMYQLTFPTEQRSLLFDDNTGMWFETMSGVGPQGRHMAQLGIPFLTKTYVSDAESGSVYVMDPDNETDNGDVRLRQVTTRHIRASGNEFCVSELYLNFETGVGLDGIAPGADQLGVMGYDPKLMVRVSRDGGRKFGNEKLVSLGRFGDTLARVVLRRLGSGRDFVVQLSMTDPVRFVISSGSAEIESADD